MYKDDGGWGGGELPPPRLLHDPNALPQVRRGAPSRRSHLGGLRRRAARRMVPAAEHGACGAGVGGPWRCQRGGRSDDSHSQRPCPWRAAGLGGPRRAERPGGPPLQRRGNGDLLPCAGGDGSRGRHQFRRPRGPGHRLRPRKHWRGAGQGPARGRGHRGGDHQPLRAPAHRLLPAAAPRARRHQQSTLRVPLQPGVPPRLRGASGPRVRGAGHGRRRGGALRCRSRERAAAHVAGRPS